MYSSYLCAAGLGHQNPAELQQQSPQSCQQDLPLPLDSELPAQGLWSSAPVHFSLPRRSHLCPCHPVAEQKCFLCCSFPAQSACSRLPGYFKTVLKALTATSVNPGFLPRVSYTIHTHTPVVKLTDFYYPGCITQEAPSQGWDQL